MWRAEDEALLGRLEDELVLERLFHHHVGTLADASPLHPRAAGLIAATRTVAGGNDAVRAALDGDVARLAVFLEAGPMTQWPPVLIHHLALYFGKTALTLENVVHVAAASAWTLSIAAWLALGEERSYLDELERAVLGNAGKAPQAAVPGAMALRVIDDLGQRAEKAARDLAPSGRTALLALARIDDATRLAGVSQDIALRARQGAEKQQHRVLESALAVIGEALDEANVRGKIGKTGLPILSRALEVWTWSGMDEAVEQFTVDRLATIGWELYRARAWDALRRTFAPFRPIIEHFASRIERDPSRIAFAAPCAQMFVFLTDVETVAEQKLGLAERAVRLCPTHRNGRLNLASLLCDQAITTMRSMVLFARRDELARVEALLGRAEALYPRSTELPEAKAMLERVKRGRIAL